MVRKWRYKCATARSSEIKDILLEFKGICDDAQGLIEVKDRLVEPPSVVIHALVLLCCGCICSATVEPDTVITPSSPLDMLISTPVQLPGLRYGGDGPLGLEWHCYNLFPFLLIYFLFCLSLCTTPCLALFTFLYACFIAYLCVVLGHILHDT